MSSKERKRRRIKELENIAEQNYKFYKQVRGRSHSEMKLKQDLFNKLNW